MEFHRTELKDLYVVDLEKREDERGFFARAWCSREFREHGLGCHVEQANLAHTARKGVIRGLHYQLPPHQETKFVRCIRGAIFDVAVDLRLPSPTFGRWFGVRLDAKNGRMLYVPPGFAHGYQALADDSETFYMVSSPYTPGVERGVRWDDYVLGVEWPIRDAIVTSVKDANWPDLETLGTEDLPE